jgi:hypothetical protein
MNKPDIRKVNSLIRQIVWDNIKQLGIDAVEVMSHDLRRSGYTEKANLIDTIVKEYVVSNGL